MYKAETFIKVRYYETDLMGVVHHSNYIRYFECGRDDALVKIGLSLTQVEDELGVMMPVIKVECTYKIPAKYGDTLRIISTITELPKVKIIVNTDIFNQNNELVCTGSVTLAFISKKTRKTTRAPELLVKSFAPFFKETT